MHGDPLFLGTRSEVVVAADAVWSLFHAGLLPADAVHIRRAADAAGVPIQALKEAQGRRTTRIYAPPRADYRTRAPEPPSPAGARPAPAPTGPPMSGESTRFHSDDTRERHREGARRGAAARAVTLSRQPKADENTMECSACGQRKSVDEFSLRADRPGKRWTACIPCRRSAQHARYLSVEKRGALDRAQLEFIWSDVDNELELSCSGCGNRFVVGERVAGDAVLAHVHCPG